VGLPADSILSRFVDTSIAGRWFSARAVARPARRPGRECPCDRTVLDRVCGGTDETGRQPPHEQAEGFYRSGRGGEVRRRVAVAGMC